MSTCSCARIAAARRAGRAFGEITSLTGRRQLRWIAWGTVLGVGPFAFGYALPWALGVNPPLALQLTAIPLGLVPLAFASAIVRYRLRDVEVIVKRGLAYAAFLRASVVAVPRDAQAGRRSCSPTTRDPHNWRRRGSGHAGRRAAGAAGEGGRAERARPPVLSRPLRLPARARRLCPRPEHRPRRRASQPSACLAHRRDAGRRPHGADAGRRAVGDFRPIGDFGFVDAGAAAARAARRSSRGSTPATPSRSTIRSPPRASPPKKSSSGAIRASTTSCRASSRARPLPFSRSGARRPTSRSTAKTSRC